MMRRAPFESVTTVYNAMQVPDEAEMKTRFAYEGLCMQEMMAVVDAVSMCVVCAGTGPVWNVTG